MISLRWNFTAICKLLLYFITIIHVGSIIQTEFDSREPKSFADRQFKYLNVRQEGFDMLYCHNEKDDVISIKIPSWGMFGTRWLVFKVNVSFV